MNQPLRPVPPLLDANNATALLQRIRQGLSAVLSGKDAEMQAALTCLVAGGHLLLEDVPGVGKTTLAESLARVFGLSFARVQFTSDLLPADIIGAQVFRAQTSEFEFRPGPIFHQMVLADELNRAPPRTQSALLEAMAQAQVSVDGVTHALPSPFVVVATQNPVDLSGTYPLPDSQLDRFLMRLSLGHPSAEVEAKLLSTRGVQDPVRGLKALSTPEELVALQRLCAQAEVEASVAEYIVRLCAATRVHPQIERGASTRATLALAAAAKARALWEARTFVTPADVRAVFKGCIAHRLLLKTSLAGTYARDEAAHLLDDVSRKTGEPK